MEKKTERLGLVLTKTEKAMLGILAQIESTTIGESVSEGAIVRKLIRQAYEKTEETKNAE